MKKRSLFTVNDSFGFTNNDVIEDIRPFSKVRDLISMLKNTKLPRYLIFC